MQLDSPPLIYYKFNFQIDYPQSIKKNEKNLHYLSKNEKILLIYFFDIHQIYIEMTGFHLNIWSDIAYQTSIKESPDQHPCECLHHHVQGSTMLTQHAVQIFGQREIILVKECPDYHPHHIVNVFFIICRGLHQTALSPFSRISQPSRIGQVSMLSKYLARQSITPVLD